MGDDDTLDTGQKSVLIILLNLPVYFVWGWVLFRTWGDFWEEICLLLRFSRFAPGKLGIWFIVPLLLIRLQLWLFLGI